MTLANRIVVLTVGQGIGQVGTPLELYERPENEFVAKFIGSPAMNLLPGKVVEAGNGRTVIRMNGGGTAISSAPSKLSDVGLSVNVGVRPEDFVDASQGDAIYRGTVEIVEALGEVTQLYCRSEGSDDQIIAKLPGVQSNLRGTDVRLSAKPEKVQVFHEGQSFYYR